MSDANTPDVPPPPTSATPPVPKYGEFAPVDANPVTPPVPTPGQVAPGAPAYPPAPQQPGTPQGGPQLAYGQPGYAPPAYAQPAYPQPVYGQPGFGQTTKPRRTWDLVLTIVLLVLGAVGALIGVFYGLAFSSTELLDEAFRQQGMGGFDGDPGAGPMVLVVSHVVLYLVALGVSILLLITRKIAFWVPLTAGVIAAIIFWSTLVGIMMSDPGFMNQYGGY